MSREIRGKSGTRNRVWNTSGVVNRTRHIHAEHSDFKNELLLTVHPFSNHHSVQYVNGRLRTVHFAFLLPYGIALVLGGLYPMTNDPTVPARSGQVRSNSRVTHAMRCRMLRLTTVRFRHYRVAYSESPVKEPRI